MTERAAYIRAYPNRHDDAAALGKALKDAARLTGSDEANAAQLATQLAKDLKLTKAQAATLAAYSARVQSVKAEPGRLLVHLLGGADFDEKPFVSLLKRLGVNLLMVNWDFDGGTETSRYCIAGGRKVKITDFIAHMAERDPGLALTLAIEEDAIQAVGRLLQAGQDPNAFIDGRSLLSIACQRASMRIVDLLLKVGADPCQPNRDERAELPINQLIRRFSRTLHSTDALCRERLAPILDHCADLDVADAEGVTPLMIAAGNNRPLTCRLLLDHGAGIDRRDHQGRHPLFYAAQAASEVTRIGSGALALLLEAGADPSITDNTGNTALYPACSDREAEALLLSAGLRHQDLVIDDAELPPLNQLILAIRCNRPERATELLARDPSLLVQGKDQPRGSLQPTWLAVHYGRVAILKQLFTLDPDLATARDTALVTVAAANGQLETVRYLLARGMRVDSAEDQSLLKALEHGHDDVARLLVEHGALSSVGADHAHLAKAIRHAAPDLIETILGATTNLDVVERASYGERYPLFSALKYRADPEILRLLLEAGAPLPFRFPAECVGDFDDEQRIIAFLRACLDFGGDLEARAGDDDPTCLIRAAKDDKTEVLASLLAHGAEVNATDIRGRTALSFAAGRGFADAVRQLLAAGADKHLKDRRGFLPWSYAKSKRHKELMDLLAPDADSA